MSLITYTRVIGSGFEIISSQFNYLVDSFDMLIQTVTKSSTYWISDYSSMPINEYYDNVSEFDNFLKTLDSQDKKIVESAIKEIKSYSFVENIKFENHRVPTLIINLPEVNRDNEKTVYGVEYNLLRKIKVNIDFYIDFP